MGRLKALTVSAAMIGGLVSAGYGVTAIPVRPGGTVITLAGPVTNEGNKCCKNKRQPRRHSVHAGSGR